MSKNVDKSFILYYKKLFDIFKK